MLVVASVYIYMHCIALQYHHSIHNYDPSLQCGPACECQPPPNVNVKAANQSRISEFKRPKLKPTSDYEATYHNSITSRLIIIIYPSIKMLPKQPKEGVVPAAGIKPHLPIKSKQKAPAQPSTFAQPVNPITASSPSTSASAAGVITAPRTRSHGRRRVRRQPVATESSTSPDLPQPQAEVDNGAVASEAFAPGQSAVPADVNNKSPLYNFRIQS